MLPLGPLVLLLSMIYSNQDIVRALFERDPEEFRYIAKVLGYLELPEDLNSESMDLSYLCKGKTGSDEKLNSFGTISQG